ncbi:gamma-glutamylputrescine synthetase [Marinobacterium aestuarii]|uniref:Gamma-glutamylputrescine synthetase n=1 Tax=Marinobacterium aestuarii TaxID=1821621 RepID=A0A1A9EYS4_9GAMM|nr:glutamine synthetase family protein [Marinobacterium aestuarii]ANG63037.1 gamma-glutamylputrescine synthetase [Marinobacterium aestuarii]
MSSHSQHTEAAIFLQQNPDMEAIDLLIPDLNGVIRGKRIEREGLEKVYEDGVNMPASLFSLDITGNTVESCGLGLEIGEPDRVCRPEPGTLKLAPWQRRPMAQLMMHMFEEDGSPFFGDPRHVLARVLKKFDALGLTPVVAVELEFYLIDQERDEAGRPQPPLSPRSGKRDEHTQVYSMTNLDDYANLLEDIAEYTAAQDIPADTAVAENAPGQFEINLKHQDDALVACDNALLLKRVIKSVAEQHGMEASFMAKPYSEEAGNGMHIHISLLDAQGNNVFAKHQQMLEHGVGGLLQMMPASMALFCPNVNSYRRLQPGYYVPIAPNWGYDNRTVAVRIPAGTEAATRIEHRVSGADANPYLVMSALLAGVHHGLQQECKPGPDTEGNAFADETIGLPIRMPDALELFRQSEVLRNYLGSDFVDLYDSCKSDELSQFERHVSELETQWYLSTL